MTASRLVLLALALFTPGLAQASGYPLGQPAPDVTLRSLDGASVRLADLRGSVVVLDFWATWCVPCWEALAHTEELAAWAKSSGLPVKVFALNTMESTKGEELRRQIAEFLRAKKLDLPVLLDSVHDAFSAFHEPGLPSLVIIGKDGRLARYHSSRIADMVKTVRSEVEELAKAPAP
jgi:cytochrome c biogenesis protein CcmG, thiol:disulfide interchange protein DsbE